MISDSLFPEPESTVDLPPGLLYEPHFLDSSAQTDLLAAIDEREWSKELKRRVQHYGFRYEYKARRVDRAMRLGPGVVQSFRLHTAINHEFDQLIVNEYIPGQGIAPHIDCEPCFEDRIALISLGWAYEMEFQHTDSGSAATLPLAPGSLLVLSGPARYEWTHQIRPRLKDRGVPRRRRVSLTFRKVILGD